MSYGTAHSSYTGWGNRPGMDGVPPPGDSQRVGTQIPCVQGGESPRRVSHAVFDAVTRTGAAEGGPLRRITATPEAKQDSLQALSTWKGMVLAMVYYLIVCRSLTYAQRTAAALERAGITAHILRSPKAVGQEGCSHAVKVSERNLADALLVLSRVGLTPKRVYIMSSDGSYKEVLL